MLSSNIFAAKNAINKQLEFGIFKISSFEVTTGSSRFDFSPCFFQKRYVSADCFSLDNNTVVVFKMPCNIVLSQRMVAIAILFQDLPDSYQRQFFRFKAFHRFCSFVKIFIFQSKVPKSNYTMKHGTYQVHYLSLFRFL